MLFVLIQDLVDSFGLRYSILILDLFTALSLAAVSQLLNTFKPLSLLLVNIGLISHDQAFHFSTRDVASINWVKTTLFRIWEAATSYDSNLIKLASTPFSVIRYGFLRLTSQVLMKRWSYWNMLQRFPFDFCWNTSTSPIFIEAFLLKVRVFIFVRDHLKLMALDPVMPWISASIPAQLFLPLLLLRNGFTASDAFTDLIDLVDQCLFLFCSHCSYCFLLLV